jgi:hypothetical protein
MPGYLVRDHSLGDLQSQSLLLSDHLQRVLHTKDSAMLDAGISTGRSLSELLNMGFHHLSDGFIYLLRRLLIRKA